MPSESNIAAVNEANAVHRKSSVLWSEMKPQQSHRKGNNGHSGANRANALTPGRSSSMLPIVQGRERNRRGRYAVARNKGWPAKSRLEDRDSISEDDSEGSHESSPSDSDGLLRKSNNRQKKESHRYQEVVRGKAREELPGHDCPQCQEFWKAVGKDVDILAKSGIKISDLCKEHSRHRARFKPPETPESYWNLSMQSVGREPGMNINESLVRN